MKNILQNEHERQDELYKIRLEEIARGEEEVEKKESVEEKKK